MKVVIDVLVEEAIGREQGNKANIRVYIDGSGHKKMVGAAAVLYQGFTKSKVVRQCLGM